MSVAQDHIKANYPLPVYNYRVTILEDGEALVIGFSEVSGLNVEYEPVTYKHGLSFAMGSKIIPGARQPIRITLKRGMVKSNDLLQSWLQDTYSSPGYAGAKRDVLIDLCDEAGEPLIRWTVLGALPVKMDGPTFDATSNDVAIENMELVAHGLQVEYDP